jgi:hypothetical protein
VVLLERGDAVTRLADQVTQLVAEGWEVVGSGKVLIPFEAKHPKPTFAERVEGFHGALTGEKLLDDDERWVQLRERVA